MELNELLNLHQPWDCERFPKSKTICFGGGGGLKPPRMNVPTMPENNILSSNMGALTEGMSSGMDELGGGQAQLGTNLIGEGSELSAGMSNLHNYSNSIMGSESKLGRAMSANMAGANEQMTAGINTAANAVDRVLGQKGLAGGVNKLMSLFQGGSGGGGGGAGGGEGAMGPASGGLARLGASKLQQKKAGMGRRQTYLTKA